MTTLNTAKQRPYSDSSLYQVHSKDMSRIATIILAGGQGTRLYPLTRSNCKPAVTFGGKYRLIDIPMSNALNSGCQKIFIVTQFLSKSLHDHIFKTYRPNLFTHGCIEILTVEEKPHAKCWFQGTADCIRQNLEYLVDLPVDYFLILSGDQLYQMDYQKMLETALETNADVIVAALPVDENEAKRFGILKINQNKRIIDFIEKPHDKKLLDPFKLENGLTLGSMGIYLFKRKALIQLLMNDSREDFGKHLIPSLVEKGCAAVHFHEGYWEDIGTIESYYKANINLTQEKPAFNLYDEKHPIAFQPLNLPAPQIANTQIQNSVICEGSLIEAHEISHSIIGPRAMIKKGTLIKQSYIVGNDFYHLPHGDNKKENLQIGENCRIERTIIDKHVTIGHNVQLINKNNLNHYNSDEIFIRDGILIVARGASIPDGFVL